jgi:RNA polymerase sigma-70 factor (ECF subfamily)
MIPWTLLLLGVTSSPAPAKDPSSEDGAELTLLMIRYQAGDGEAAEELVRRLMPRLFRFYSSQGDLRLHAEDASQDFWVRFHRNRQTYRPSEPFLPWFYSLARRARVDEYRRRARVQRREQAVDHLPEIAAPQRGSEDAWGWEELLAQLPESQREVLMLTKVEGLSLEEAARATGSTVGAVKQRIHRAYEKLRSWMAERGQPR